MNENNTNFFEKLKKLPLAALALGVAVALSVLLKLFNFIGGFIFLDSYGGSFLSILLDVGSWLGIAACAVIVVFLLLKKKGVIFLIPIGAFVAANAIDYTLGLINTLSVAFDFGIDTVIDMSFSMISGLSSFLTESAVWVIIAILILANNVKKFAFFKKAEKILWIIAVGLMAIQLLSGSLDLLGTFFDSIGALFDGSLFNEISVSLYVLPQGFLGAIVKMVYAIAWLLIICEFSYPFTSKSISGIISETFGKKNAQEVHAPADTTESEAANQNNENE